MKTQKGFTLFELVFAIWVLGSVTLAGFGLYVVIHFISKFW